MIRYKLIGEPRKQRSKSSNGKVRIGKNYVQRYKVDGEATVKSVSLQTTDLSNAYKNAEKIVEQKIYEKENEHANKSFTEHLADFIAHLHAEQHDEKHIQGVEHRITNICQGLKRIEQIDEDKIKKFVAGRVKKGELGEQTAIHYRTSIKQFTRWLARKNRLAKDPLRELKRKNGHDVPRVMNRRAFTPAELKKLISNARKSQKTHHMLNGEQRAVLYALGSETGYRVQELASITPADVTWGSEPSIQIDCRISKRRKYDRQEIKPSTAKALRRLTVGLSSDAKIFPGAWWRQSTKMLRKDSEGLEEHTSEGCLSFHGLRHTFISNVVASGAPMALVMRICRLSTPALLERYYHENKVERRNIINGL